MRLKRQRRIESCDQVGFKNRKSSDFETAHNIRLEKRDYKNIDQL